MSHTPRPLALALVNGHALRLTHPPLLHPPHPAAVVDAKLTPTEVDIIFSSIKSKGERRINYREFCDGVQRMATAKVRGAV